MGPKIGNAQNPEIWETRFTLVPVPNGTMTMNHNSCFIAVQFQSSLCIHLSPPTEKALRFVSRVLDFRHETQMTVRECPLAQTDLFVVYCMCDADHTVVTVKRLQYASLN